MGDHTSRRAATGVRAGLVGGVAGAILALSLGALAAPIGNVDHMPRVAFLARNDNPFDAMAVGPVAGALGGIVAITPPTRLSEQATAALAGFDPDVIIIAGGTAAISPEVEAAVGQAGDWDVGRAAGTNRDHTAQLIAQILADYGVGRPLLTGGRQVVGNAYVGGTLSVDTVAVQDTARVRNLNADRVDSLHGADLGPADADVVVRARDNTVAAGNALAAAVAGAAGKVVRVERGIYDLGSRLVVPNGTTVVGAGSDATILRCDSCGSGGFISEAAIVEAGPSAELAGVTVQVQDMTLSNVIGVWLANGAAVNDVTVWIQGQGDAEGVHVPNGANTTARDLRLQLRLHGPGSDAVGIRVGHGGAFSSIDVKGLSGLVGVGAGPDSTGGDAVGVAAFTGGSATVSNSASDLFTVVSGTSAGGAVARGFHASGGVVRVTGGRYAASTAGGGTADVDGIRVDSGTLSFQFGTLTGGGTQDSVHQTGGTLHISHADLGNDIVHQGGELWVQFTHARLGMTSTGGSLRCSNSTRSFSTSFDDLCP